MKILYHHRVGSTDGGEIVHMKELIAALSALGHEVTVSGPVDPRRAQAGQRLTSALKLRHVLPRALSELLELALSLPILCVLLARYFVHRPDIVYERANLFSVAALALKRLVGCPLLVEVNAPLTVERSQHGGLSLQRLARWSEEVVWRGADHVLPVSRSLAQILSEAGVPEERIVVVPNGVRAEDFVICEGAKQELGLAGHTVVGFVGYPREWNRLDRVIRLLPEKAFENVHFMVVGDGAALPGLRRLAEEMALTGRVTFVGEVARERVPFYVSSFDIAVQPGVTAYACPLKIIEYMAMARAIAAPDLGNVRELLEDGQSALLFEPGDEGSLRSALLRLSQDAALRARLGAAARAKVGASRYTWADNAELITGLAGRVLSGQPRLSQPL